jgi:hypothetical protein
MMRRADTSKMTHRMLTIDHNIPSERSVKDAGNNKFAPNAEVEKGDGALAAFPSAV